VLLDTARVCVVLNSTFCRCVNALMCDDPDTLIYDLFHIAKHFSMCSKGTKFSSATNNGSHDGRRDSLFFWGRKEYRSLILRSII